MEWRIARHADQQNLVADTRTTVSTGMVMPLASLLEAQILARWIKTVMASLIPCVLEML
jgi:hypothetical protein